MLDPDIEMAAISGRSVRPHFANVIAPNLANTNAIAHVGGTSAEDGEYFDAVTKPAPWVFAFVLGFTFVLLTLSFRSIVVAATAVLLNLLSVGAAYGLLVLVFEKGVGIGLLGFQQVGSIDAWVPLFLFSVLFGLSIDYQVFLLSRIKEHYDATGDTIDAVRFGVISTARIITGAALIIVTASPASPLATWSCSSKWASASPSHSSSTRPSSARSSCPARCSCWVAGTGISRGGSAGSHGSTSRDQGRRLGRPAEPLRRANAHAIAREWSGRRFFRLLARD